MKQIIYIFLIFCFGCSSMKNEHLNNIMNETKEFYVVYDDSYTWFMGKYNPNYEEEVIKEGYQLILNDPVIYKWGKYRPFRWRVYRRPYNRRYWFLGKFIMDKNNEMAFIPITSSKNFNEKDYNEKDIESIKSSCSIYSCRKFDYSSRIGYYNTKDKGFNTFTRESDSVKYRKYFLFSLGNGTPQLLVIDKEYGKKLMEKGIILPNPNELKDKLIWQDYYNYWGQSLVSFEVP